MVVWLVLYIFLPPFGDFFLYNQKNFLKNNLGADLTWTVPVPCPILFGQRDIKEIYCQNQSDCIVAIVKWTLCILTPDQIKYYKIKMKTLIFFIQFFGIEKYQMINSLVHCSNGPSLKFLFRKFLHSSGYWELSDVKRENVCWNLIVSTSFTPPTHTEDWLSSFYGNIMNISFTTTQSNFQQEY